MPDRKRRVNGLEPPWHPFQIATWVLFPLILAHYYAFLMHLLWRPVAVVIVLTILFSIFAIATAVFAYFTLAIDPADDAVLCEVVGSDQSRSTAGTIHCYLCERDVDHSSKHCRFCDKCIVRFDHHCKWLNTCIGSKNYPYFLGIVASVLLLTLESLGISIALVVEAFAYSDNLMDRVRYHDLLENRIGSDLSLGALQGLLLASAIFLFFLVVMIIQLASFHAMLLIRGITTYDYIVSEQKRLREKENQRLQKKLEKQQKAKARTVGAAGEGQKESASHPAGPTGGDGIEMRAATASGSAEALSGGAQIAHIGGESKAAERSNPNSVRYQAIPTLAGESELCEGDESDVISYEQQLQQHQHDLESQHSV